MVKWQQICYGNGEVTAEISWKWCCDSGDITELMKQRQRHLVVVLYNSWWLDKRKAEYKSKDKALHKAD